jgi:hypothetical protein
MVSKTIKEKMNNNYEKPDKPTNHRVPRRKFEIVQKEKSNEMWYQ